MKLPTELNFSCNPFKKVLIVSAALVACSSTSVSSADSTAEGPSRSLRSLDELESTYVPFTVHGSETTNEDIPSNQERIHVVSEETTAAIMKKVGAKMDKWGCLQLEFYEEKFNKKLGKIPETTGELELFERWVKRGLEAYSILSRGEDWPRAVYSVLATRLNPIDLIDFAHRKMNDSVKVLRAQIDNWHQIGLADREVYDLLKLQDTKLEDLFESPQFEQWVTYVFESGAKQPHEVYNWVESLSSRGRLIGDWEKALAGTRRRHDFSPSVFKLQKLQLVKWESEKKTSEDVLELLQLKKWKSDEKSAKEELELLQPLNLEIKRILERNYFYPSQLKQLNIDHEWLVKPTEEVRKLFRLRHDKMNEEETEKVLELLRQYKWSKLRKSQSWLIWKDYLYLANKNSHKMVLESLESEYGTVNVAMMLCSLKGTPIGQMAEKFQVIQFERWVENGVLTTGELINKVLASQVGFNTHSKRYNPITLAYHSYLLKHGLLYLV